MAEDLLEGLRKARPEVGSQQVSKQAEWKVSNPVQLLREPDSDARRTAMKMFVNDLKKLAAKM